METVWGSMQPAGQKDFRKSIFILDDKKKKEEKGNEGKF